MASYGRVQGIFNWIDDNFEEFDGWCCEKGIDPAELPAYRVYNLAMRYLKEGRTPEGLTKLENSLRTLDSLGHPWLSTVEDNLIAVTNSSQPNSPARVKKSSLTDDEQFALEGLTASATGKMVPRVMPDWYRGEEANYKIAKNVMGQAQSLPKST